MEKLNKIGISYFNLLSFCPEYVFKNMTNIVTARTAGGFKKATTDLLNVEDYNDYIGLDVYMKKFLALGSNLKIRAVAPTKVQINNAMGTQDIYSNVETKGIKLDVMDITARFINGDILLSQPKQEEDFNTNPFKPSIEKEFTLWFGSDIASRHCQDSGILLEDDNDAGKNDNTAAIKYLTANVQDGTRPLSELLEFRPMTLDVNVSGYCYGNVIPKLTGFIVVCKNGFGDYISNFNNYANVKAILDLIYQRAIEIYGKPDVINSPFMPVYLQFNHFYTRTF